MSDDFRMRLELAGERGARLLAATEEMNVRLLEVERAFVALNLGVEARIEIGLTGSEPELAFGKMGSDWRIHLASRTGRSRTQILHASRSERAAACAKLPLLLEELLAQTERELEDVRDATRIVEKLLAEMAQ